MLWPDRVIRTAALLLALAGCKSDAYLPQSGPSQAAVLANAQLHVREGARPELRYALVPLNPATITVLGSDDIAAEFPDASTERKSADGLIGVGDQVTITVFESGSGGLFLPREGGTRSGNFVTIPTQQVSKDGTIEMPYAGTLRVVGLTPHAVSVAIQARLSNRALEPQVVVSMVDRRAGPVSVLGEVAASTRFTLDPGGARMLEAIARAGGPRFPAYESMVTLQRDGMSYRALLSEIADNAEQNVELRAKDVIYVAREPRYFLAMGAIGQGAGAGPQNRRFSFEDSHIMLADALAKAGGLLDQQANAAGVFIYRTEPRATLVALGIDPGADRTAMVPTIYALNLRDPAGYFYASRFAVRGEDVLFVSNAPATDLTKFLDLVVPITGSAAITRAIFR